MGNTYDDGQFTIAQQHGDIVVDYPLLSEGVKDAYVIYRQMIVERSSYTPTDLDTPLDGFFGSNLVAERNFRDIGVNLMQFEQVYANIPPIWSKVIGSETREFPGYIPYDTKRPPFVTNSPVRVTHNYQYGQSFNLTPLFQPTINGFPVNYVADAGGAQTATDPTLTEYEAIVAANGWIVVDVKPEQYMGNIYDMQVFEVRAK